MSDQATEQTDAAANPPQHHKRQHPQAQAAPEASQAVASNAQPSTEHDEYAIAARDEAVEARAQEYVESGSDSAAQRYRERFQDAPTQQEEGETAHSAAGPGQTAAGTTAAPTA